MEYRVFCSSQCYRSAIAVSCGSALRPQYGDEKVEDGNWEGWGGEVAFLMPNDLYCFYSDTKEL